MNHEATPIARQDGARVVTKGGAQDVVLFGAS